MAVDAGRAAAARESRARAIRRSIGRSVVSLETPPRSSAARPRAFVRSFVRQREDVLNRIESKSTAFETRIDGSIDGSIALHREVGILGRSRDARETNR